MLVLTRKLMEKLYIGDAICVTVVRLEGGQVRLGIEAPREIAVVRAELLDQRRGGAAAPLAATAEAPAMPAAPAVTPRPDGARGIGIRRRGPSR
jgi:carbon storage regulator